VQEVQTASEGYNPKQLVSKYADVMLKKAALLLGQLFYLFTF